MASPFLLDISRDMRLRGYSLQTEKTYLHWILRYIRFIDRRHPSEAGPREVREFLTWLAADRHVAINTQKIALTRWSIFTTSSLVLNLESWVLPSLTSSATCPLFCLLMRFARF